MPNKDIMEFLPSAQSLIWARTELSSLGYGDIQKSTACRSMPWSNVLKLETSGEVFYLKIMAEAFAYEAELLNILNHHAVPHIPYILASNTSLRSIFMMDCGHSLREKGKEKFEQDLYKQAVVSCANFQKATIHLTERLIQSGIPDYRLTRLPFLYGNFICRYRDVLASETVDVEEMEKLSGQFKIICNKLVGYSIPAVLEQGDFHDNNILVKNGQIILHDFGDASITHPFFSLSNFIGSFRRNHPAHADQEFLDDLRDYYLGGWQSFGTLADLREVSRLCDILHPFIFALSYIRVYSCKGMEMFPEFTGYLGTALNRLVINLREFAR